MFPEGSVLHATFAVLGTMVGAGFASGQEMIRFFARFGNQMYFMIILNTIICSFVLIFMLPRLAYFKQTCWKLRNELHFGKPFSTYLNLITQCMFWMMNLTMVSAAGALMNQQWHIPRWFGALLFILISCWIVSKGLSAILSASSIISIGFVIFLGLVIPYLSTSLFSFPTWQTITAMDDVLDPNLLIHPLIYTSLNIGLSQSVLTPLAIKLNQSNKHYKTALLVSLILNVLIMLTCQALQLLGTTQWHHEMPLLLFVKNHGQFISLVYELIVLGELLTTFLCGLFSILKSKSAQQKRTNNEIFIIGSILFGCSFIPLPWIVSYLYPIAGICCMVWLIAVFVIPLPKLSDTLDDTS